VAGSGRSSIRLLNRAVAVPPTAQAVTATAARRAAIRAPGVLLRLPGPAIATLLPPGRLDLPPPRDRIVVREPAHLFPVEHRKPEGQLDRLADDRLVADEQADARPVTDTVGKETPVERQPVDVGRKETLDGAIAASWLRPAADAISGDTPDHGQDRLDEARKLPTGCLDRTGCKRSKS